MKTANYFPNLQISVNADNIRRFDPAVRQGLKMRKPKKKPTPNDRITVFGPVKDPRLTYDQAEGVSRGNPLHSGATK